MSLQQLLPVVQIWLPLAAVAVVCTAFGGVPDYRNGYWDFAIGCWAFLDFYWAIAVSGPVSASGKQLCAPQPVGVWAPYALYCLPLGSVPLLGLRILPRVFGVQLVGAILCALGISLAVWSRRVLGGSWSGGTAPPIGRALVRRGPYSTVRHPIYLGLLSMQAGMILALGEARAVVLLYGVVRLLLKLREEEAALREAFPAEYLTYEREVKRLVPWIW